MKKARRSYSIASKPRRSRGRFLNTTVFLALARGPCTRGPGGLWILKVKVNKKNLGRKKLDKQPGVYKLQEPKGGALLSYKNQMICIYNPITKMKWFEIWWCDRVFSIFNYFNGKYLLERKF